VESTNDVNDFKTINKVGKWPKWIDPKTGMRSDAAHTFVHPLVQTHENLHVLLESKCVRVIFEGQKAVGVEYYKA
jgi:alcohol oxidase